MSFVSVEQLDKSYGATSIFRDIDFAAARGEFVTLLGPSGCGKSTLLRCIAGLTEVDSGRILIDGEDVVPLPPQKRGIAMVFQSYALFPNMTVQQNVAFGLRMQKVPAAELKQRVAEAIELVELGEYAARYPHQLSGGQCQRVALARSLVTRPRLLLLDEPLSALDARIRKHLREQIRRIQQELGLTTVFVTHDQEEALTLSDRIVLMNAGRIVQSGDAETLYTAPENASPPASSATTTCSTPNRPAACSASPARTRWRSARNPCAWATNRAKACRHWYARTVCSAT